MTNTHCCVQPQPNKDCTAHIRKLLESLQVCALLMPGVWSVVLESCVCVAFRLRNVKCSPMMSVTVAVGPLLNQIVPGMADGRTTQ